MAVPPIFRIILCACFSVHVHSLPPQTLTIGAVLTTSTKADYEDALNFAVDEVNNNSNLLPDSKLKVIVNKTDALSPFKNIQSVQYLIRQGVVAIIGPMTSTGVKYTQPYCAGFHIPQIAPTATDPSFAFTPGNFPYLLRLSSSDSIQCHALADLIQYYNWTQMAILTSKDDYGVNGLLAIKDIANKRGWKIVANEHFETVADPATLNVDYNLGVIQKTPTRIVVLNTHARFTVMILKQAARRGMLKNWAWLVTDGSTNTEWTQISGDFKIFEFYGILGTRPAFSKGTFYNEVMSRWRARGHDSLSIPGGKIYDAVLTLAVSLDKMIRAGHDIKETPAGFDFTKRQFATPWPAGARLLNYTKEVNTTGVMSTIAFDSKGSPMFSEYDIVNLGRTGFLQVGKWSSVTGVNMDPAKPVIWLSGSTAIPVDTANTVENTTIRLTTVIEYPFVFVKETEDGEKHYKGFCIDLLKKLQEKMKFHYTIQVSPNNIYGAQDVFTLEWSGMVRSLMDGKSDLAIGSFTINSQRQGVIDFTQPYMDIGLTILMKKEIDSEYKVFSFLKPFNTNLWLAIVFTTLGVGVFLWLHATFSPHGYHGRYAQSRDRDRMPAEFFKTKNNLRFFNAIWSSFSYYVSQGPDVLHPVSLSGRVAVGFWWFAVLIIGATYTANLASFLIVKRFVSPIESVEDLARQTKIEYGIPANGQAQMFFQTSSIPTYVTMWEYMSSIGTLVRNSTEGVRRVREGNYALIYDSVILEFHAKQKPCDTLHTVGKEFGRFGYGFGLKKNSPFTHQFSVNILDLRQKGYIDTLRNKWLTGQCMEDRSSGVSSYIQTSGDVLTFTDMSGVFYSVFFGMVVSVFVLLTELLLESHRDSKRNKKQSPCDAMGRRITTSWLKYRSDNQPRTASVQPNSPLYFNNSFGTRATSGLFARADPQCNDVDKISLADFSNPRTPDSNDRKTIENGITKEDTTSCYKRASFV